MQDHQMAFGPACMDCHDGVDRTSGFDHAQTDLPLEGQHAALACAACHKPAVVPAETPAQCADCHEEPAGHAGVFEADCAECHTPLAWKPAALPGFPEFAHTQTQFQLVNHVHKYDGFALTCRDCHTAAEFKFQPETCTTCHADHDAAFMTQHLQEFGPNCVSCHDGTGNMKDFDHARVFGLDGGHAALECQACHAPAGAGGEQQFRGTPRECSGCHQEPEVHAGLFGLTCEACHSTSAWAPARLTQHTFPLDHGEQGEIACATCHVETYMAYTCYGCHEHEPEDTRRKHSEVDLSGQPLENCAACHATGRTEEGEDR
jgi:hypothetical protein